MDEGAAQQLYERMVTLEERARELDQHLRSIQDQLNTLAQTRDAIKELQELPKATETWIPIAPGAFVRGTISPASSVLLAVGASVAVEKSPEQVKATLQGHEDALSDVADQALSELKQVFADMDTIKAQVEQVSGEKMPSGTPGINNTVKSHEHAHNKAHSHTHANNSKDKHHHSH